MRRARNSGSNEGSSALEVRKAGYLHRKGKIMRQWNKKYYVLDDWHLRYYHDIKEMQDGAAPNGIISLSGCTVHDGGLSETFGTRRIHLADGIGGRVHCMSGEDAEEVDDWLQQLTEAVARRKRYDEDEGFTPVDATPAGLRKRLGSGGAARPSSSSPSPFGHPSTGTRAKFPPALHKEVKEQTEEFAALLRQKDAWRLLYVEDGVRVSILRGSNIVKGSCVMDASADDICRLMMDASSRMEWDPHFADNRILESFGPRSYAARYTGRLSWRRQDRHSPFEGPGNFVNSIAMGMAVGAGAAAGAVGASSFGLDSSVGAVLGAAFVVTATGGQPGGVGGGRGLGGVARGVWSFGPFVVDLESMAQPRELVLMRHAIESERGVFYVPEWSVEHKAAAPAFSNGAFVRARTGLGGFAIEELVQRSMVRSQVTYIADFDPCGWLPASLRRMAGLERLRCLSGMRELVAQTVDATLMGRGMKSGSLDDDWAHDSDGDAFVLGEQETEDDVVELLEVGQIPEHTGDMASAPAMTWAQCPDVSIFNVRGPHYVDKSHELYGKKVPSQFSLYNTVAVDMFKSDAKDLEVWRRFQRPAALVEGSTAGVPNTLCVVQIFPNYQPSMFGAVDDGASHNLVMWFTLAETTKQMLRGEIEPTNAIALLKEWSKQGDPLHPQWKSIAQIANVDAVDAGFTANKMLRQYNGKPFLSNISHHVVNDGETLTVVSDVHTFGYMLKNYYYNNQQTVVKDAVIDLAYVIEGREGAHLPEQVLASARVHNLDISSAKTL